MVAEARKAGPWKVWKALRVRDSGDVGEGIARYGEVADGILLDAWHPEKMGGTGRVFPWEDVARLRPRFPEGLILAVAGGLKAGNVRDVIIALRPHVVDVSSGVESRTGIKDRSLVEAFIRQVRKVDEEVAGVGRER